MSKINWREEEESLRFLLSQMGHISVNSAQEAIVDAVIGRFKKKHEDVLGHLQQCKLEKSIWEKVYSSDCKSHKVKEVLLPREPGAISGEFSPKLDHIAMEPEPEEIDPNETFPDYIQKAGIEFQNQYQRWTRDQRVACENIMIAYEQLVEKVLGFAETMKNERPEINREAPESEKGDSNLHTD